MVWMSWFDDSDDPLPQRVQQALDYHWRKYGKYPNIVELPLNEDVVEGLDIEIKHDRYVLPCCMFVGIKRLGEENELRTSEN